MVMPPDKLNLKAVYRLRFSDSERIAMSAVWRVLIDHAFQRWVKPTDAVLDVGAGLCNFINNIRAARRVAMDADPSVAERCQDGVIFVHAEHLAECGSLGPFDVVFISNLLEHLANSEAVLEFLCATRRLLKPNGRVMILQPNFALIGAAYFDFIDHKTILTDKSLIEALELNCFKIEYVKCRFLPYTSKSSIPKAPWMVRLYLALPFIQYFMGKQTFIVASSPSSESAHPAGSALL